MSLIPYQNADCKFLRNNLFLVWLISGVFLQIEAREAASLNIFKKHINKNIPKSPTYFSAGNRKINIIHTKLRHNCILNNDLFRRNIIGSPLCSCGQVENSYNFFFSCPLYNQTFNELLKIDQLDQVLSILTFYFGEKKHNLQNP